MDPISTLSGKTAINRNEERRRQRRVPVQCDQSEMILVALEGLVQRSFTTINILREHINMLRNQAVSANELIEEIRKSRKIDVEI